jgi:hypothetical protein
VFSDIHWGRSNNSPVALQDNEEFTNWMIDEARTRGCEVAIFCGDFFDSRHNLGVNALNCAMRSLEKLNNAFQKLYFIPGNHDLYLRASRDVSSIVVARNFSNIDLIFEPKTIGDVTFLPWLVGDEHKNLSGFKSRYVMSHLEMAGFLMNAKVEMPDGPHAVKADQFVGHEYVFTGHFHMRQAKENVVYLGNVMPFSFSDAWDEARGFMILGWGKDPEFLAWPDQPLYRTMTLSQMLNDPGRYLRRNLTARVAIDIDMSYEEAQVVKDAFTADYGLRKVELVHQQKQETDQNVLANVAFQSVDKIVVDGLLSVQSTGMDPAKLVEIYKSLPGTL